MPVAIIPILRMMWVTFCSRNLVSSLAVFVVVACLAVPVARADDTWRVDIPGLAESPQSLPKIAVKRQLPPLMPGARRPLTPAMQQGLARYRFELKGAERWLDRSRYRAGLAATERLNLARSELSRLDRVTGQR